MMYSAASHLPAKLQLISVLKDAGTLWKNLVLCCCWNPTELPDNPANIPQPF